MSETPTPEQPIRIVGLCGSLRAGSFTRPTLALALEGAAELGADTTSIDLRDFALPFCNGNEKEDQYPPSVFELRTTFKQADGIILATPEYHGGYSGVLKNALDLMGFEEFEGKMVGLVGVGGGRMGAINALNSLRDICRTLHAWVIPDQASIPQVHKMFDDQGQLKDADLANRIRDVGRQVARFAYLHSSEPAQEFLRQWETARENPGGDDR